MSVLSEEKIMAEWYSVVGGSAGMKVLPAKVIRFARAIEAAVLEAQAGQEPFPFSAKIVAWKADQKENMAIAVEECKRANEAERKLAVAQEALKNLFLSSPIALECNDMHHAKKDQHEYDEDCPVLSRYEDALSGAREALAQIGGDDAGS